MPIPGGSSGCACASPGRGMDDAGAPTRTLTDRLSEYRARTRAAIALAAGAVTALGQAPVDFWPASAAGLFGGLFLFLAARTWRTAFATGWTFGTGYFAFALFWIVEPFLVDVPRHGWMAPFALLFMAGGLALFWGAAYAVAHRAGGALAWAAALGLAELARGYVLTGFPWAQLGHVWIGSDAVQWAALIGPGGLTVATLGMVAGTAALLAGRARAWWIAAPLPFLAFAGAGTLMLPAPSADRPEAPVIRLVQPNAPQDEKWHPDKALGFYQRQIAYTAAPASPAPDLVVWPETAIPWPLDGAGPALEQIADMSAAPVVLGLNRRDAARYYNALVVVGEGGQVTHLYDKHHLVPFGEYIPFGGLTRWMGLRSFAARDGYGYSPGPGARLLDLGEIGVALPLICYEAIFPQDVRAAPGRPDFLLQITNDAWFGTISGPFQHLAQARLRAVEQGLPLVRVANTGVSAVIDASGRIGGSIPLGEAGWLDVRLPEARPPTLYARTGDWPVFVLLLATLAGAFLVRRLSD